MTETPETKAPFRSGFVAIAGAPNVGKSTLLNRVLGEKISITSKRPQTTRNRILGILHRPDAQLVFIDTPGVHRPSGELNRRIVATALTALGEADLVLVMVDAVKPDPEAEKLLLAHLKKSGLPAVLAINKIDRLPDKRALLVLIDQWAQRGSFREIVPISALDGTQVDRLVEAMVLLLPQGPPFYPEDSLTDLPQRFIVAEMIREKVFRLTGQEIPYASAVTIEQFERSETRNLVEIHAKIHVERDSQKGIIIGKGGAKLKEIGQAARRDIQRLLQAKVYLKLFVRVQKNWSRDTRALRRFGYE